MSNRPKNAIFYNNPVLVQCLGLCPALAVTTSLACGLAMGLLTTLVLVFSCFALSLLKKFIPKRLRIVSYLAVISGFVTVAEIFTRAFFYEISGALGIFLPLIAVNCIILARTEGFASKNKVLPAVLDGLFMGLGFTAVLVIVSFVRELLGAGTLFGVTVLGSFYDPAVIFLFPAGAFFTLGILAAAVQKIRNSKKDKETEKEENV